MPGSSVIPVVFTTFLLKVASRCNIACDYCYVYEHADQSWRTQPPIMSTAVVASVARRISEYVDSVSTGPISVLFHGGEPLLAGAGRIAEAADVVRREVNPNVVVRFGLQTNGTLLDEAGLRRLAASGIAISLSIDGPRQSQDRHRVDRAGGSTFPRTLAALELLESHRYAYGGLLAVIDPAVKPEDLFAFFGPRSPPLLDLLLPDGNHESVPRGRTTEPNLYVDWLLRAFDVWFDGYPQIPVRTFESILGGCLGLPSATDVHGIAQPHVLVIETDGSYQDLDWLKTTKAGAPALGLDVVRHPIEEVAIAPKIQLHRERLTFEGLAKTCQKCPEVDICGGGSVQHRYSAAGFDNTSVYCAEMWALIRHARTRLTEKVCAG